MNRSTLLRRGLGILAAALWLDEGAECATSLRGFSPRLDALLDSLTVTLTVVAAVWALQEHYARRRDQFQERKVAAIFTAVGAACDAAGVPVPEQEAAQPEPCMRLVSEKRDSA